ncbi:MAG: hypothetical protein ABEH58_03635 [Haloplanus sp.]
MGNRRGVTGHPLPILLLGGLFLAPNTPDSSHIVTAFELLLRSSSLALVFENRPVARRSDSHRCDTPTTEI